MYAFTAVGFGPMGSLANRRPRRQTPTEAQSTGMNEDVGLTAPIAAVWALLALAYALAPGGMA